MSASKNLLKKGFVVKFIFSNSVYNLRVSWPLVIVLLGLIATSIWGGKQLFDSRVNAYKQQAAELEKANSQYRSAIALKEREREQMASLAEDRFNELWSQLETQDKELNKINRVVGNSAKNRRALKGSRSGYRHHALELKYNYKQLMTALNNRKGDIGGLHLLAADYRRKVENELRQQAINKRLIAQNTTPSMWPTAGEISSDFGSRFHPVYGYARFHSGLDIAANFGTPIYATAAGTVTYSGWMQGYGNAVEISHGHGLSTLYGHCQSLAVPQGTRVTRGQTVAYVGSTGVSTGPHCHYEVRTNGNPVNPVPYLSRR